MFDVDHIPVWLRDRDSAVTALAEATGLPILEGYAPDGRRVARGVRFANGPFVDLHQADEEGPVFLGLGGDAHAAEEIARRSGWKARLTPHTAGGEPWTILSFAPGQGLLSLLFVIQYATDDAAWSSPVFNGGLYNRPARGGAALTRVRLAAADRVRADADLRALGFRSGDGGRYHGRLADLMLMDGEDAVLGVDVAAPGPPVRIPLGSRIAAAVGGSDSQQG